MGLNFFIISGATAIDYLVGDPPQILHPVAGFGKVISILEQRLNHQEFSPMVQKLGGVLTVIIVLNIGFWLPFWLLRWLGPYPWLFWPLNLWLMSTTIAASGLNKAGSSILKLLRAGYLEEARIEVGKIVGRDTAGLSETEIIRATVETIAENTVDGMIAPLFFGCIGGTPLAMLYRVINTLDSMIGYKNDRYLRFGWAAARLDDLANFIPARICALLIFGSSFLLRRNWRRSIRITFRDAHKHPSPNGGWPESAVAGALGIRLGGVNFYQGIASFRSYLGDAARPLELTDIGRTIRILNVTVILALFIAGLLELAGFLMV